VLGKGKLRIKGRSMPLS